MMTSSINKDYMDIEEFLSSKELCDALCFPENDNTDDELCSNTDPAECDPAECDPAECDPAECDPAECDPAELFDNQLKEYTAKEIIASFRSPSPLSSDEGNDRSISLDSFSSTRDSPSHGESMRGKRDQKIDKNKEDSNPGKARTSTWHVSKSPDKKNVATSVEIESVSYTYKLLPTSKRKKKPRKQSVPGDLKDGKYWDRRVKNNKAAKRSRDLRRQKEITVASKAVNLEVENEELRNEVTKLRKQLKMLNKKLEEKSKEK